MLKVEKVDVYGWEAALRGMRNPLNSWNKSDSKWKWCSIEDLYGEKSVERKYNIGPNDLDLMKRLAKAGPEHRKYMRMVSVWMDITAPIYFFKEFDTYKVGTVANSCSTMHKIHSKKFTLNDFSHEHLFDEYDEGGWCLDWKTHMYTTIERLNWARGRYLETRDKKYWWQMIQLLPTSYNQKRTVMMNYEVVHNIISQRSNHKLDEWHQLIEELERLPFYKEIAGGYHGRV